MTFYDGYVPTKNKKPLISFKKSSNLYAFEQVEKMDEYAGKLAKDAMLIDLDTEQEFEILLKIVQSKQLKCRVLKSSRGGHFLFKINRKLTNNRSNLAIGIVADIKGCGRASIEVLKMAGEDRPVIYDSKEYDEVPKWLLPVKTKMDFLEMESGDGRNQALFNYILTLQSNDFSVDEARETICIINEFVLKEPLPKNELEVILRDEAFQKPIFFKDKVFLFDKFATYIKNNNHIVKINNQLHIYKDGIYVDGQAEIEAEMIKHIPNLNRAKRTEVMSYLDILIRENVKVADANLIAFKNGIYNLADDSIVEFSPSIVITNKINWNYNPTAESELVENTLNKLACYDGDIRNLLEEAVGYCFYRRNELRKAFILTGDKANGKSTFLDMVKTVLGDENTSALDLGELGARFKAAELFGKLANIGDDIGDEFIANPAIFKKLVTGDRVNVERKGQNPFDFNNYSKFLFSANNIPRIKDKTGAVLDRLAIIPFNATFSKDDPDYRPYIKYELRQQENIEYLIKLAIKGLKRVLENQAFSKSEKMTKELQEYEEINNPIIGFYADVGEDEITNEPSGAVYRKYQEYCLTNSLQPLSQIEFSRQINKRYGFETKVKRVGNKKIRCFIKKDGE